MAKPAKNKRQGVPGTGGDPAGARRRSGVPKAGTLAALQAAFFESPHQAETLLRHSIPALFEEASYSVVHPEEAERADRTDVSDEDGLSYLNYGPPAAWQAPYSALRVALAPVQDTDHFIYHGGEEILVPTAGRVRYRFFHTVGGEPPRTTMSPDVLPGMAIRINPQLPHHGWLPLGHEPRAQAWMFFLSVNRAPTDISFRHGIRNKVKPEMRRITPADFETALHPARFALVAWGLAEAIRLRRQASNLNLDQLAKAVNISRSHLSRVESGKANVSLSVLADIAAFIHFDIGALMRESLWDFKLDESLDLPEGLDNEAPGRRVLCDVPYGGHSLHVTCWNLQPGSTHKIRSCERSTYASWIILEGRGVFDLEFGGPRFALDPAPDAYTHRSEILERGAVLHVKGTTGLAATAIGSMGVNSHVALHLGSVLRKQLGTPVTVGGIHLSSIAETALALYADIDRVATAAPASGATHCCSNSFLHRRRRLA